VSNPTKFGTVHSAEVEAGVAVGVGGGVGPEVGSGVGVDPGAGVVCGVGPGPGVRPALGFVVALVPPPGTDDPGSMATGGSEGPTIESVGGGGSRVCGAVRVPGASVSPATAWSDGGLIRPTRPQMTPSATIEASAGHTSGVPGRRRIGVAGRVFASM